MRTVIPEPFRLGLGAKVRRNAEVPDSTDPVERHLIKKLGVGKRRVALAASQEKSNHNSKEKHSEEDEEEDDEPQSRASAFSKKRSYPPAPHFQPKKKHK